MAPTPAALAQNIDPTQVTLPPPAAAPAVVAAPAPNKRFVRPRGSTPRKKEQRATLAVRDQEQGNPTFVHFILQQWNRTAVELMQVIHHTEGSCPRFFGSKPVQWVFTGTVFDAYGEWDWASEMLEFYERRLKGSRGSTCYMQLPGRFIHGVVYGLIMRTQAPQSQVVHFNFNMIALEETRQTLIDRRRGPTAAEPVTPAFIDTSPPGLVLA